MKPEDNQFLKAFFNAVSDRPLEPDVPLYDEALTDADLVQQLPQAYRALQQVVDKRLDRCRPLGQGCSALHRMIRRSGGAPPIGRMAFSR